MLVRDSSRIRTKAFRIDSSLSASTIRVAGRRRRRARWRSPAGPSRLIARAMLTPLPPGIVVWSTVRWRRPGREARHLERLVERRVERDGDDHRGLQASPTSAGASCGVAPRTLSAAARPSSRPSANSVNGCVMNRAASVSEPTAGSALREHQRDASRRVRPPTSDGALADDGAPRQRPGELMRDEDPQPDVRRRARPRSISRRAATTAACSPGWSLHRSAARAPAPATTGARRRKFVEARSPAARACSRRATASLVVPSTALIRVIPSRCPGRDQHVAGAGGVAGLDAVDPRHSSDEIVAVDDVADGSGVQGRARQRDDPREERECARAS